MMMENTQAPSTEGAVATEQQPPQSETPATWETLGLSEESLELIRKAGYATPSPVQAKTIPIALDGHDVIGSAQTGTGKTAAFVLPMVERFAGREGTYGLILAPTREIAQQIQQTLEIFGTPRGVRSIVLIGGINMRLDAQALSTYPQIIVATPGRLVDHIERGNVWLDYIEIVVLDEADRMLDMGFADQLNRIMDEVPKQRQTMLFSATIPASVKRLAERILYEPTSIAIGKPLAAATSVEQRLMWVQEDAKNRELHRLLRKIDGSIIVFTRSKDGATRVWRSLHSAGFYDATYIHSDRLQAHREEALADFKAGKYRIMIATDVAARGIHVEQVEHVINYDLPLEPEDYVHRIGRTGRAGKTGQATSFVTPRDKRLLAQIEKLIGKRLPEEFGAEPRERSEGPADDRGHGQGHSRGHGRGGERRDGRGHERGKHGGESRGQGHGRAQAQGGGHAPRPAQSKAAHTPVRALDFMFPVDEDTDTAGPADDFNGIDETIEAGQASERAHAPREGGEGGGRRRRRRGRRGGKGHGPGAQGHQPQQNAQGGAGAGEGPADSAGVEAHGGAQGLVDGATPSGDGQGQGQGGRRRRRRGRRGGRGRRREGAPTEPGPGGES